jgi:hypothetical protein
VGNGLFWSKQMIRIATLLIVAAGISLPLGSQTTTSGPSPATAAIKTLDLPSDAVVFAKLNTNLDLLQAKPGDVVEAQTTEDVKQGKEALLKKGSTLLGHVTLVEPATPSQPETMIGIVFDRVKTKSGPDESLRLLIHALAPEAGQPSNSTIAEGRGMPGATTAAAVPGRVSAEAQASGRLTASSVGVSGFANMRLEIRKDSKGEATGIIALSKGDVKLKKGAQLLLTPPER